VLALRAAWGFCLSPPQAAFFYLASWRKIAIALIIKAFGEEKAQGCANAC
jgi:hypothetical protein